MSEMFHVFGNPKSKTQNLKFLSNCISLLFSLSFVFTKTFSIMDTSFFSHINWLAVLVAAVAYFMLGALWYSVLFGKAWIKGTGIDMSRPDARSGAGGIMAFTFILELVTCIGLAILVHRLALTGAMSGIKLGAFTGIFFSSISICISYLYQKKPLSLHAIDAGYHTIGSIIAAVILCVWH
jgi:hypothetical protein